MKPKLLLTLAAIFKIIPGILGLVVPNMAVHEPNASPTLMANVRVYFPTFIALAVLDWFARDLEPSKARDVIFLANTVGFFLQAIFLFLAALADGSIDNWIAGVISLLFAVGFILVGRANMSTSAS